MKYIYSLKDKAENVIRDGMKEDVSGNIGKKAQNLKELYDSGFNVPVFSVVTDRYFKEIILKEIRSHFQEKGKEITDWSSIFSKETEEGDLFTEEEVTYMCENRSLFKLEKGLKVEDELINPNCYNFLGKREGKLCAFFYLIHSKLLLNIELDRLEKYILQVKT